MIILDTDVLIEIERGNQKVIDQLAKHRQTYPGNIGITSAVYAEFIFGYLHQKRTVPTPLALFDILDFDKDAAFLFAQKKEELDRKGKPIPIFDLITASCVLAQGATLITLDQHFRNVSGLKAIFLEEREEN
ncbi:MAG: type II toxin-antitoxin system VapC family toxin [Nanoarchaeota archaeon]